MSEMISGTPLASARFTRLPEPIRFEQMRTSAETHRAHEEQDDYWREVEWMLRVSGGA